MSLRNNFRIAHIYLQWEGEGVDEVGKYNGKIYVKINPKFYRPAEVDNLLGDSTKAKNKLGWVPKISFDEMISDMIENDIKLVKMKNKINKELAFGNNLA